MVPPPAQPRYLRYPIQLPLLYMPKGATPGKTGMGWTHNLSNGGACVELAEHLQPGMPLHVVLQTARGGIEVEAQIIWAGKHISPGDSVLHGIAFTQIAADQDQALRDLLRTSEAHVRHAGVRLTSNFPITCQRKGEPEPPITGWTEDVSRAGLMLHLPQAFSPGTMLEITLHIAGERITAEGSVVWVDPPEARRPGEPIRHGVRFTALGLFLAILP